MREPGRKGRKSKEDASGALAPAADGSRGGVTAWLTLIVPRNYGHFRLIGVMRR